MSDLTPVELWVEALLSGEYKQGQNYLRQNDNFCCLGVACDIYQKDGPGDLEVHEIEGTGIYNYNSFHSVLPSRVLDWLGLMRSDATYKNGSLIADNDNGTTFKGIAEIIVSRPEELFDEPSDD